jgi:hypothetical protein
MKQKIIFIVAALIVFGLMLAFLWATNQNFQWLMPTS